MNAVKIFILGANGASAILTGLGFHSFLVPWGERTVGADFGWIAAAILAGFGSALLQGLLHVYWWRGGTEGLLRAPLNLLAGLLVSTISWFGGAGGAMLAASHADLLHNRQQEEIAGTLEPLRRFAAGFADLRAEASSLAEEAAALAQAEARSGGTCANDSQPSTQCGPRCRLRQRQARELSGVDALAGGLEEQAREIAVAMSAATEVAAQRALYERAARLQANADQRRISDRLRAMAGEFSRPLIDVHPASGARTEFICENPEFAGRLLKLSVAAAERFTLPAVAPREREVDMSDALGCVVARVGELAWGGEPCPGGIDDGPLKFALGLELCIVVLLLGEASRHRRIGAVATPHRRFHEEGARKGLSDREAAHGRWLIRAADLHLVEAGRRGRFVAAPHDGSPEARAEAMRLIRYLGESRPVFFRVPLADLDPGWTSARGAAFGHATEFDLYPWPKEADLLMRQLDRDAAYAAE